jgi:hypothetical protein
MASRAASLVAVAVGVCALCAARSGQDDLKPPAPAVALRPAQLAEAGQLACGQCHAAQVAEWATTAHAIAWADEVYQEDLADKKKPELCHGCHVPEPLFVTGLDAKPKARAAERRLGVDCAACHVGPSGAQLGPRGGSTEAHATERSQAFVGAGTNALCAACHDTNIGPVIGVAKDFEASGQAERGRTCVGCHMAKVERAGGVAGRDHALQTPRDPSFLARAFQLSVERAGTPGSGEKVRLVIANAAGHRVPGIIGRHVTFRAELLDSSGKVVAEGQLEIDHRTYLPVDERRAIELAGNGTSVRVRGLHEDPRADEALSFLDVTLAVGAQ